MSLDEAHVLHAQLAYYRARAAEYDEWFFRTGRYDRGPEHQAAWFAEVALVDLFSWTPPAAFPEPSPNATGRNPCRS
jgi:hypothetical protein